MSTTTTESRSPLRASPLRLPGQSLEEARAELMEKMFDKPAIFAICFMLLAVVEWIRYVSNSPPSPYLFTVVAVAAMGYFLLRYRKLRIEVRKLRLAMQGEKAVGQHLESLRERGYYVFHDVLGTGFNVDHVLIGPAGIYTIETKTWSKPAKVEARILFDGESIRKGGFEPDRDPIIQASAQTGWLRELLKESSGKDFPVWPVIVFPGWFIENTGRSKKPLWVPNPKALPAFLDNEPVRMSPEDVKLASFHLSRFIRSEEAKRRS